MDEVAGVTGTNNDRCDLECSYPRPMFGMITNFLLKSLPTPSADADVRVATPPSRAREVKQY